MIKKFVVVETTYHDEDGFRFVRSRIFDDSFGSFEEACETAYQYNKRRSENSRKIYGAEAR